MKPISTLFILAFYLACSNVFANNNFSSSSGYAWASDYMPVARPIEITMLKSNTKCITSHRSKCFKYKRSIDKYATKYRVPANLITAVIEAESAFNHKAKSKVGAKGLMQLMDFHSKHFGINPYSAKQNIRVGTYLLAKLLSKYKNNIPLALAAYNAGEGAVKKYHGIPPFKETRGYVKKIMGLYQD